jgi:hypothetical protein
MAFRANSQHSGRLRQNRQSLWAREAIVNSPAANDAPLFTDAQIAAALGKSRQSISRTLEEIPAERVLISGNAAPARPLAALPAPLRSELAALAARRGYRDAAHMLREPDALWQPAIPLAQCGREAVAKAAKLQTLLSPFLQASATETRSQAQIESALAAASPAVFGYQLNGESLRRLLGRVLDRDRGRQEWHRLELFLDDRPGRKSGSVAPKAAADYDLAPLADALEACRNKTEPTAEDREFLFDAAFRLVEELNQAHPGQGKPIRRAVLRWLFYAVPLSKSRESLERLYKLKFRQWQEGGRKSAAIKDRRGEASGWFRRPDLTRDREIIRDAAILRGGNISGGYHDALKSSALSAEWRDYYSFDARHDKSRQSALQAH